MFERYTERARLIPALAKDEAHQLGHDHLGTEHPLLGLIREGEGIAGKALVSLGVTLDGARLAVERIGGRGTTGPVAHLPYTERATTVLNMALREALSFGHNYIGTEHILLGLIREGKGVGAQALAALGVDLTRARHQVVRLLAGYQPVLPAAAPVAETEDAGAGLNLTAAARALQLDPVVARERELDRIVQVLTRRTRNNVVLVGESGVGKTAVVHALAQRLAGNAVPDVFQGRPLYAVDLRMESEPRLREAFTEARRRDGGLLLFVEDLEHVFGAPTPSALLIQYLVGNHEAQLISTSSPDGFRRVVRGDQRLLSVFQDVAVTAPGTAAAVEMMKGARDRFEVYHRVVITDAALVEAVRLGERYVHDRCLPASAVDLIDEAGARMRIRRATAPPDLRDFDERIAQLRRDKETAIDAQDFDRAAQLRDREKQLLGQRVQREREWRADDADIVLEVDDVQVREVVEQMLKERIDGESAAPTVPDQRGVASQVFPGGDVWTMA